MNKIKLINSFIVIGIIIMITGGVFNLLHTPGKEIFVEIGKITTKLFSLFALVEIVTSSNRNYLSKAIWILLFINIAPFAVLIYYFMWYKVFDSFRLAS